MRKPKLNNGAQPVLVFWDGEDKGYVLAYNGNEYVSWRFERGECHWGNYYGNEFDSAKDKFLDRVFGD